MDIESFIRKMFLAAEGYQFVQYDADGKRLGSFVFCKTVRKQQGRGFTKLEEI